MMVNRFSIDFFPTLKDLRLRDHPSTYPSLNGGSYDLFTAEQCKKLYEWTQCGG